MPEQPDADIIGANIRAEMGRQRIKMTDLTKLTGISRGTLWGQINGATPVTVNNLLLIARALHVEPCDLLPDPDEMQTA